MKISELELHTGVSRHTLRYYEKQGLLREVSRRDNNYRDYPEQAVQRVHMVRQLKDLGFSLKEIGDVLDALRKDTLDCAQGALLMAQKRAVVDEKIAELKSLRQMLENEQKRLERSAAQQNQIENARPQARSIASNKLSVANASRPIRIAPCKT
ncbi:MULTISPECIES: MerR family transcriptional regulator [Marinobacter]|uniref:MerR family transcriptional regulator n=1 Tax=Marinobacter TaxID=2742 RepID=UPI002810E8FB|nr:MerR family transcriptional regulator [Marinobacter sp. F26243]